jgi:hypothetical protein
VLVLIFVAFHLTGHGFEATVTESAEQWGPQTEKRVTVTPKCGYLEEFMDSTEIVVPDTLPFTITFSPANLSNCALSPFKV